MSVSSRAEDRREALQQKLCYSGGMLIPAGWDFKNPDYAAVFKMRVDALARIRANPQSLPAIKRYYREHPAEFISDWGITLNPKNVEIGLPSMVPFILYPRQAEWVQWVVDHWKGRRPGLTEKTRQMGFSWLSMATACTLCVFYDGISIGVGSRKQEYVDILGNPKSLLEKARQFMRGLPPEFRGGWDPKVNGAHMRLSFPATGAIIAGEAGDNIGRGNTTSIYLVDEAAFLERPRLVDAALSQTTNCRIDISTPNGLANPFAEKRFSGKIDVYSFHWRDDPTKDDAWYAKQCEELDPITIAQELDINYAASVDNVLIPSVWIQSAIGAARKLGVYPTGRARGAFDVADQGVDTNALLIGKGVELLHLEEWSGRGDDMLGSTQRVFRVCDEREVTEFRYDADGLGAGVAGFARALNEPRQAQKRPVIKAEKFQGSGGVALPESEDERGRKNKDFFQNLKAQSWWALRKRFQATHQAVTDAANGIPYTGQVDDLISISENLPLLGKLCNELSQPTFSTSVAGKIVVDKVPDGAKSPNLADTVMIYFARLGRAPLVITPQMLARA